MTPRLAPLDWQAFLGTWCLNSAWLSFCLVAAAAYLTALHRATRRVRGPEEVVAPFAPSPVPPVRAASFLVGLALLAWCTCSAVDAYSMSLFWMHMVEHLVLIMVVPALLVAGHPLTVARAAGGGRWQRGFDRVVRRGPVVLLTHPVAGLVVYGAVIFSTHLTPFMDHMSTQPWLMTAEQVGYLVAGWMLLVGTIGEEPIRWRTPYLLRLVILVAAMVPDTVVGIVLLQTDTAPFPRYLAMRPDWAGPWLRDVHIGGALMWSLGDGLMMLISLALVITLLAGRTRDRFLGTWLESVRTTTFHEHIGRVGVAVPEADAPMTASNQTIDDDASLEAYNQMLQRLSRGDGA